MSIKTIFNEEYNDAWKTAGQACTIFAGSVIGAIYGVVLTHSKPTIPPVGLGLLLSTLMISVILIQFALHHID